MDNRAFFRTIAVAMIALFAVAGTLAAQSSSGAPGGTSVQPKKAVKVGDPELKRFAGALKDVHLIQVDFQSSFTKAITSSPLGQKEFFKIYQSERSTHKLPADVSPTERQQYKTLINQVVQMEQKARTKMIAAVKKDGFKLARFDELVRAVNSDPKLAKRLRKVHP